MQREADGPQSSCGARGAGPVPASLALDGPWRWARGWSRGQQRAAGLPAFICLVSAPRPLLLARGVSLGPQEVSTTHTGDTVNLLLASGQHHFPHPHSSPLAPHTALEPDWELDGPVAERGSLASGWAPQEAPLLPVGGRLIGASRPEPTCRPWSLRVPIAPWRSSALHPQTPVRWSPAQASLGPDGEPPSGERPLPAVAPLGLHADSGGRGLPLPLPVARSWRG